MTLVCGAVSAADTVKPCRAKDADDSRPRIGLVLGGGGARGIAHLSVLKELERLKIPVDCIAGTSMGSLIGGLYASGMATADMEKLLRELDWQSALKDDIARKDRSFRRKQDDLESLAPAKPGLRKGGLRLPSGIIAGENIQLLLERLIVQSAGIRNFDQLPIPYRAVATDINSGEAVVLAQGSLAMAMRASMSIPAVFNAVEIDGRILVDGGLVNQVPIDVVRDMGADIVIAVDVGTPLGKISAESSALSIADQLMGMMTVGNTRKQLDTLTKRDILIQPVLGSEVTTASFEKAAVALAIGDEAARAASPALARLSAPEAYRLPVARNTNTLQIAFVELDNTSAYDDRIFLKHLNGLQGKVLDPDVVEDKLRAIYGQYPLELATYEVVERNGQQGLQVKITPKTTGAVAGEFGLNFSSNTDGQFLFNLVTGFTIAPMNASGGELRTLVTLGDEPGVSSEWYQPFSPTKPFFSRVKLQYVKPLSAIVNPDGDILAEYDVPSTALDVRLGRSYGNWGEITLGATLVNGHVERTAGLSLFPEGSFNMRLLSLNFNIDEMDSLYLPRSGHLLNVGLVRSMPSWGADEDFSQFNAEFMYARAFGRHSGFGGLRYHTVYEGEAGLQNWYPIGGVTRFAGFQPELRHIENYGLAFVGYSYELGKILGRSAVVGGTLEHGKLWTSFDTFEYSDWQTHASAYFGFDSWLGLLIMGYGRSHEGDSNFFIELGRTR